MVRTSIKTGNPTFCKAIVSDHVETSTLELPGIGDMPLRESVGGFVDIESLPAFSAFFNT